MKRIGTAKNLMEKYGVFEGELFLYWDERELVLKKYPYDVESFRMDVLNQDMEMPVYNNLFLEKEECIR